MFALTCRAIVFDFIFTSTVFFARKLVLSSFTSAARRKKSASDTIEMLLCFVIFAALRFHV